jgi:cytosine deaminase
MSGVEDKKKNFDALTVNSAKTMGLENYGLSIGCNADLVILQAEDVLEGLRLKPTRLAVIRRGKVIAHTEPKISHLQLDGRPGEIDMGRNPTSRG